jgi:hypothetical protein
MYVKDFGEPFFFSFFSLENEARKLDKRYSIFYVIWQRFIKVKGGLYPQG